LEAVRTAAGINQNLGNLHRLFEEFHELFDDLLGLGLNAEYLEVRAESRALAFSTGNIPELLYLFDEHLQYHPEQGFDQARFPELRAFYEALRRYLLGLGLGEQARQLRQSFLDFLRELQLSEWFEHYRELELD